MIYVFAVIITSILGLTSIFYTWYNYEIWGLLYMFSWFFMLWAGARKTNEREDLIEDLQQKLKEATNAKV